MLVDRGRVWTADERVLVSIEDDVVIEILERCL